MRSTIALVLLASAAPLAAHAQTPQDRQRQFEIDQRFEQQRIDSQNLEIQRQMNQALRNLTPPEPQISYQPAPIVLIPSADARTRQLAAQLAAANARVKALEAEKKPKTTDEKQPAEKP